MDAADWTMLIVNFGLLVATGGATAVAWRGAIAADRRRAEAKQASIEAARAKADALAAQQAAARALEEANEIWRETQKKANREETRADLREWFQTLSHTAATTTRRAEPRLRARIEEVADAHGYDEVVTAMRWASAMHDETYARTGLGELTELHAHNIRVIIKRRFRRLIGVWANNRDRGIDLIDGYTSKGWPILVTEPGWRESTRDAPVGAVASITGLLSDSEWDPTGDSRASKDVAAHH